jgi:hypothetical protein
MTGNKKSPRWLKEQTERKKQLRRRFYRLFFLFLMLLFLILGGFKLWHFFQQSVWDGKNNFNFVLWCENQFYVVSYRSGTEEINLLEVSPETYLPLAKGFGEYRASAIWQLGQTEKFGGGQLLALSTQYFLGIPIEGWGRIKTKVTKKNLWFLTAKLLFTKEKNLHPWDLLRFLFKIQRLTLTKTNFYSLDKTRAGEEIELPDGQRAFKIKAAFLDNLVKDLYKDAAVLDEGIIWAVINQSQHSGLARQVARLIDNLGGEVTAFYEEPLGVTEGIYCGQPRLCQTYTARLLSRSLNLPLKGETLPESRAEAVIVVGENYWQFFHQK